MSLRSVARVRVGSVIRGILNASKPHSHRGKCDLCGERIDSNEKRCFTCAADMQW
jgi:hypothetical protein